MAAETRKGLGDRGEEAASRHLEDRGYTVLKRNYRKRFGEVDIIAQKEGVLVFIEVKTRSSVRFGSPGEAVDRNKRRRICAAALHYVHENDAGNLPARFDVIEIYAVNTEFRIRHITNAFAYEEP